MICDCRPQTCVEATNPWEYPTSPSQLSCDLQHVLHWYQALGVEDGLDVLAQFVELGLLDSDFHTWKVDIATTLM